MSSGLDTQKLVLVFKSRPDILEGIEKEATSSARIKLFNNIANFVHEQTGGSDSSEPSLKRRRVDVAPSQNGTVSNGVSPASSADVATETVLLEIKDISVSVPQRKKFDLCLTAHHIYARAPNSTHPVQGAIYAWKDIEYIFYLPVPEKTQQQYNYILFPRNSYLSSLKTSAASEPEPLVFTVSAGAPKPGSIGGPNATAASSVSDTYSSLFHWAINKCLKASNNDVKIVAADPAKFKSMLKQPHRPKDPAVHVKAFRGSKDGFLFFLENGILWGYKKPLMFIPKDRIGAVSYTNILQRTFNVVVEVFATQDEDAEATEELEFAMVDQEDYDGINKYVIDNCLQDRSLTDQRKAKIELAENKGGKKGAGGEASGNEDDGLTVLERAGLEAQQLGEEDSEDEEDYDPGSEGDSEGSGDSSDEDDDDGEGGEMDEDDDDDDE